MKLAHSYSSLKQYDNCPKQYYHQRISKEVTSTSSAASVHGERVHKFLENRVEYKVELPKELEHMEPAIKQLEKAAEIGVLKAEMEFTLTKDLKPTKWSSQDAWMRSKLDVFLISGIKAFNFDWKTGKRNPDYDQLELFSLQIFTHYPDVETVKSGFIWTRDMAMDTETYTRDDVPKLWSKVHQKVQRIEQSVETNNWPARPSGLCRFCAAQHLCEFKR